MKKVINVKIGELLIPIDDTALEALNAYLTNLRHVNDDDMRRDEIVSEAEVRASLLLNEILKLGHSSINDAEMDLVISKLKEPAPAIEPVAVEEVTSSVPTSKPTRLLRNSDDLLLGGVCSGIAHYFDIDPSVVRVLFAVFALSGWAILLYFLLWIIVPAAKLGAFAGKRIYRNVDTKILGGVASGLARYFSIDVTIVRLIFISPIIINILFGVFTFPFFIIGFWIPNIIFQGSISGTFFLAYLLLWIILPPSKEESIAHSLGWVARVSLIFLAGVVVFCLFVGLIAIFVLGASKWPFHTFAWANTSQALYAYGSLFLFLGAPFLGFLIWVLRRMTGAKAGSSILKWTFGIAWFLGWVSLILFIVSLIRAFPTVN